MQTISCQTDNFVHKTATKEAKLFQCGILLNCLNLVEFYGGGGGGGWLIWPPSTALVRELGGVELRALALVHWYWCMGTGVLHGADTGEVLWALAHWYCLYYMILALV